MIAVSASADEGALERSSEPIARLDPGVTAFAEEYCTSCHGAEDPEAELPIERLLDEPLDAHTSEWERVVRKLRRRQMPPPGHRRRPNEPDYESVLLALESRLDRLAEIAPDPGRTSTFRRLTRTEYRNAIRDLLALDLDVDELLPEEDASHGFDNVTVTELSPTLVDRYLAAAEKISRLAIGRAPASAALDVIRVRPDLTQEKHLAGLPLGTRGGVLFSRELPSDGEYEIRIRLARDRDELVEGLREPHELEILIDRKPVASFTIEPPRRPSDHATADAHLVARVALTGGAHDIGVTFVNRSSALAETLRQPYDARFNRHRHPRLAPALYQVAVAGPYDAKDAHGTRSRRRIFGELEARQRDGHEDDPDASIDDATRAERIISRLLRRAYRRPIEPEDLARPLALFRQASAEEGFDAGIELALAAILSSPHFLFRIERDPEDAAPGEVYRVSDLELASRLSFFLWSSLPDDELLDAAERGVLSKPEVLEAQTRRMLADSRSSSLATSFAGQWLHLRNLALTTPDQRLFPDFDDNLRQALGRETELLFDAVVREDRSVLDLIRADFTFLDERLARHYGIPHVFGSRFRRVELGSESERGGILRHGSILAVTSYPTRTSPVLRGNWILANLIGTPPPPPPPDVPALERVAVSEELSIRERLAQHRRDPACAGCHRLMDPIGFPLERYDAVGRFRALDRGRPIDATGAFTDGSPLDGVADLEEALLRRPEIFVEVLTEKLLVFALGRGVEPSDAPAVREIVRRARSESYKLSSIVLAIVSSPPFQLRRSE